MNQSEAGSAPLGGKLAVVTGGNSGIGRAAAEGLARQGAHVVIACRNEVTAAETAKAVTAATGTTVDAVRLDLADLESVRDAAAEIRDIIFEPNVVRSAAAAASGVDHVLFIDQVADAVLDPAGNLTIGFALIGGARFAEDYLDPGAMAAQGYRRLLDTGLTWFLETGEPGLMVPPGLLTPVQQERLAQLRVGR